MNFSQIEVRCENGITKIYQQDVNITKSDWYLYSTEGCCNCSSIIVECCEESIPTILYCHFSEISSSCSIPTTIQLVWNGNVWASECTQIPEEECYLYIELQCTIDNFYISGPGAIGQQSVETFQCNPFEVTLTTFIGSGVDGSDCTGSVCCNFNANCIINTNP